MSIKKILIALVLSVVLGSFGTRAYADMTADDVFNGANDILKYDSGFSGTCSTTNAEGSTTDDKGNAPTAYNYFIDKGLSDIASAAIVGNFRQESSVNPLALNKKSGAFGIAQWTSSGNRKERLQSRDNYKTLEVQLDYVWDELQGSEGNALSILKNYKGSSAKELAVKFGEAYERYGDGEEGKRGTYAQEYYDQYGGGGATIGTSGTCGNDGNGDFVYYSQTDAKWAKKPYGSGTVGVDGCGPTSVAMIVATLYDKSATPDEVAALGASNGSYQDGVGTLHLKLLEAAKKKYGLAYTDMTDSNIDQLMDIVRGGGLVYMGGSGAPPFTTGGHIVVMRGVTDDGKIIIADPYRGKTDTYTKAEIEAGRGSTFGIQKG